MMESKFVDSYNPFISPVCNDCVHYIDGTKCRAFNVIPDEILLGDNDHSEPLAGQKNNLVFTPKKENYARV